MGMPDIPVAEARGKAVEIPGRDGTVWLDDQAFKDVALEIEIALTRRARLDEVAAWLSGRGRLVLSTLADFAYDARVAKGFDLKAGVYADGCYQGRVTFTCKPFRVLAAEAALLPMTAPGEFHGRGSWFSRPEITVYGTGDITLTVNGVPVFLNDVDGHIVLDCDAMMALREGVNASPQVTLLSADGEWPRLRPEGVAMNEIDWSGDVSRVEILPRWRWR